MFASVVARKDTGLDIALMVEAVAVAAEAADEEDRDLVLAHAPGRDLTLAPEEDLIVDLEADREAHQIHVRDLDLARLQEEEAEAGVQITREREAPVQALSVL